MPCIQYMFRPPKANTLKHLDLVLSLAIKLLTIMLNFRNLLRRMRHNCILTVENDSNLFQSVTSGLGVAEVGAEEEDDEHDDKNKVVLPANSVKSNSVDKGVDEDGCNGRAPGNGKTTRSEAELPDLARVGSKKRSPKEISINICKDFG